MKFRLLLLTAFFSLATLLARASDAPCAASEAKEGTKKNEIAGGVVNAETKKPIGQVSITAYNANKKEKVVVSDANGNYAFSDLKPGTYKFVFEKDGFKRVVRDKVQVRTDDGYQLNIEMLENEEFQFMPGQLLFSDFE